MVFYIIKYWLYLRWQNMFMASLMSWYAILSVLGNEKGFRRNEEDGAGLRKIL